MKRNGISLFGRAQFPLLYSERSLATHGAEKEVEIESSTYEEILECFRFDFYCFTSRS